MVGIGSPYSDGGNGTSSGLVRIYKYQEGSWTQIGNDVVGEAAYDLTGYSVSLSNDGSIVSIGDVKHDGNGVNSGRVRVFDLTNVLWSDEFVLSNFQLYPNPTKTKFTIQLENSTELQNVTIYNNLGQQVLTSKKTVVDTSKLASGLYVVEIETNKGKGTKKLIIE